MLRIGAILLISVFVITFLLHATLTIPLSCQTSFFHSFSDNFDAFEKVVFGYSR